MRIRLAGTEAHLEGDWTITGVVKNIDSLADSLQQLEAMEEKKLRINCGRINTVDSGGLQLLYVWMQCARFRGIEPTLVNMSDRLRQKIKGLMGHCLTDSHPEAPMMAG